MNRIALLALTVAACSEPEADDTDNNADFSDLDLVSASGLDAARDAVQIVDVRDLAAFERGHIPGALSLPGSELRGTVDGVAGQAIDTDQAHALFEAAGVQPDQPTVVYGASNDTTTARVFWSLAHYGATDALVLLDGGLEAWEDDALELSETPDEVVQSDWSTAQVDAPLRVDKQWVLDHLDDPDVTLYDVRTASEYSDGHIPGAINVNWTDNLASDGSFLPSSQVLALHGDPAVATVVVYCQSGARASVSWSLLAIAGLPDVRLYDGSWNEWGADDTTPKTQGSAP